MRTIAADRLTVPGGELPRTAEVSHSLILARLARDRVTTDLERYARGNRFLEGRLGTVDVTTTRRGIR
jgi:hypothetical protein